MNTLTEFKIMRYLTPFLFAPVLASAAPTMADFYQREEIPLDRKSVV